MIELCGLDGCGGDIDFLDLGALTFYTIKSLMNITLFSFNLSLFHSPFVPYFS
jgi:hypothetical protein